MDGVDSVAARPLDTLGKPLKEGWEYNIVY